MAPDDGADAPAAPLAADFVLTSTDPQTAEPFIAERPGALIRFAAGAWHVLGGAAFVLQNPRLWGLALLPSLLGLAAVGAGLILGIYAVRDVEASVRPYVPRLPDVIALVGVLGLWASTIAAGVLLALSLVLFFCAPLLEWLERRVESRLSGSSPAPPPTRADLRRAYRHAVYMLPAVPLGFVVALVPFAGPVAAAGVLAHILAFQLTAPALARRGRDFAAMGAWHRAWRAEMLGFGIAALLLLPLLSPILGPALAAGATRLVYEIEGEAAKS